MSQKEIIWIFGPTAVGKSRFIQKLLDEDTMKKKFNISECSFLDKGLSKYRGGDKKMQKVREAIKKLGEIPTAIIEGQNRDIEESLFPLLVKQELPEYSPRIFFLWNKPAEIAERAKERKEGRKEQRIKDELKTQVQKMIQLQKNDFPILAIKTTDCYPFLGWEDFLSQYNRSA